MKKNNSLKLFNKLAKRAYKVSKKRKLGWKWSDAQKWTSGNLFQKYKGAKNLSKIKVTEIDFQVTGILDGTLPSVVTPVVLKTKSREVCFNPFDISSDLLDSFEWFDIVDKISILNNDVKVDLDLEFDGNIFAKTGVIKKELLPNLLAIREEMRRVNSKSGYFPVISFFIVLIEGEEDDSKIGCNYYILITFDNSLAFNTVSSKGLIRNSSTTKEQMPVNERERIELINKQKEDERKLLSKSRAKSFQLPSKVEPKVAQKPEPTIKDTKASRTAEYNKAIEKLESLLERKLITKKQFSNRFDELGKNLKDGGQI